MVVKPIPNQHLSRLIPEWNLHVGEGIHRVSVVFNRIPGEDPNCLKLPAQSTLTNDELSSICSVQTVYAICPCNTVLNLRRIKIAISIVKESCLLENFLRD